MEAIDKVQKRATKIPWVTSKLSYEEMLKIWGLTTLTERRIRGDLIKVYKLMNGLENINWHTGETWDVPSEKPEQFWSFHHCEA